MTQAILFSMIQSVSLTTQHKQCAFDRGEIFDSRRRLHRETILSCIFIHKHIWLIFFKEAIEINGLFSCSISNRQYTTSPQRATVFFRAGGHWHPCEVVGGKGTVGVTKIRGSALCTDILNITSTGVDSLIQKHNTDFLYCAF